MRSVVYLDPDGPVSAKQLYDIDVIGLPITIAQILLTVWQTVKPGSIRFVLNMGNTDDPWYNWARESQANYTELWNYGCDIMDEHYRRFGSRSSTVVDKFGKTVVLNAKGYQHGIRSIIQMGQSIPPIPEADCTSPFPVSVEDARASYKCAGPRFTYTHREVPEWLK